MSDPITTRAFQRAVYLYESGEGNHGILHMRTKLLELERKHNATITKLEALAKEWSEWSTGTIAKTPHDCAKYLKALIQEAKQ